MMLLNVNRTMTELFHVTASLETSLDSLNNCRGDMSDSPNPKICNACYFSFPIYNIDKINRKL